MASPLRINETHINSGELQEKTTKIDENFVKTKYDSLCSLPQKVKYIFYNVNPSSYSSTDKSQKF